MNFSTICGGLCEIMIIFFVGRKNQFAKNFMAYRLSIRRIEYGLIFRFYPSSLSFAAIRKDLNFEIWKYKITARWISHATFLPSKKNSKRIFIANHSYSLVDLFHFSTLNLNSNRPKFRARANINPSLRTEHHRFMKRGIPIWKIERGALLPSRSR